MKKTNLRWLSKNLDFLRVPLNGSERADRQGEVPYWGANGIVDYVDQALLDERVVLIGEDGAPFFDPYKEVAFISDGPIWPNNHIHILKPNSKIINDRYFCYFLNQVEYAKYINGSTRDKLTQAQLGSIIISYPELSVQISIADFLDHETARIDELIEKKQRFLNLSARRMDALVDKAISDPTVPKTRFENVVRRMQRTVELSDHDELVRLGLFNRGRGIFKKPAADEEGMGDSSFYFVRAGDLILSGQFAWEGAVALATEDEEGCVVSHRYPVFRGREGINTAYLLGLFRSGYGDFLLNEASRGSAGRNKPLNTWRLGKEKIPVPSRELQEAVDRALAFERRLKKKTDQSISLLREARATLIIAAVTGQIDVTTWGKQGQTDRRLDEIEEAMQA